MLETTTGGDVRYVNLHGDQVAYREAGSGEVVLLIHGMAGSSESWGSVFSSLARTHRVVAPDLLGHGRSDKPRGDYSLGAFAAGLRDLLDQLDISQATIVGHSLGGGVAMQFLYQHPDYCRRLVLVSSGGLGPDVGWILRMLSAPGVELAFPFIAPPPVIGVGKALRAGLGAMGLSSPRTAELWRAYSSFADRPTRQAFVRTLRSVVDYRGQSVSALTRLRVRCEVPTLLIWGDKDQIIPVEHGHEALAARVGSRLEVLPGVGHFPQIEAPAEVVRIIGDFLAEPGTSTEHAASELNALLDRQATINRAIGILCDRTGLSSGDVEARIMQRSQSQDIGLEEAAQRQIVDTVRLSTRC